GGQHRRHGRPRRAGPARTPFGDADRGRGGHLRRPRRHRARPLTAPPAKRGRDRSARAMSCRPSARGLYSAANDARASHDPRSDAVVGRRRAAHREGRAARPVHPAASGRRVVGAGDADPLTRRRRPRLRASDPAAPLRGGSPPCRLRRGGLSPRQPRSRRDDRRPPGHDRRRARAARAAAPDPAPPSGRAKVAIPRSASCPSSFSPGASASTPRNTRRRSQRRCTARPCDAMSGRSRAMPTIEQEYIDTRPKSRALYERAVRNMPSGVAHDGRVFSPFPFYIERADSARKWDVDGHIYLDCWSGHGALILGHNHPAIVAAITEQAKRGLHYSACHELEVRWAELIRSCVPGAEKVRFTMTGTETTALAARVARVATGRP